MSDGTGGLPGLPKIDMAANQNISTDVSSKNIFDLIRQGYSQSYSSVLPYVQAQFGEQSKAAEPQFEALRKQGEQAAASAQSDAMARGLRGSDIEAAGMASARSEASKNIAQLRSQLAMAQAQSMAENIMKTYGYDIQQNTQLYQNLAQAIAQKMARDQEARIAMDNAKALEKANRERQRGGILESLIKAGGTVVGGIVGGPVGAAVGGEITGGLTADH